MHADSTRHVVSHLIGKTWGQRFTTLALLTLFTLMAVMAQAAPSPVPASTVSLVFAGDIVLDDAAGALIERGGDPFAAVAPVFKSADIREFADQSKVRTVWYPGLESHPDHAVATATMRGFGGVVSFEIEGDSARAHRFIDALTIPTIGPSLGGVESMVSPLAVMGYANVSPEERAALGIRDELVRLCLGIEDTEDLIADLAQALERI